MDRSIEDKAVNTRTIYVGKDKKPIISLPELGDNILDKLIEKIKDPRLLGIIQQKHNVILSKLKKIDLNLLVKKISVEQLEKIKDLLQKQKILPPNPPWYTLYAIPNPILCVIITIIFILLYPFIWFMETLLLKCFLP
jgi:hypothetical protein